MRANAATLFALAAFAASNLAAAANPSVADLDAVQSETIMLRAKATAAKAQQELREYSSSAAAASTGTAPAETQLPTAKGLFGANGKRYVVFQYANGGMAEGVVGQKIPGNFHVVAFDSTGVDLRSASGRRHRIPFSMQAPVPVPAAQPTAPAGPVLAVPPLR